MKREVITEGKVRISVQRPAIVTKGMEVFYNPEMMLNRDLTLKLLIALKRTDMTICDPLAGSGIRSLRMIAELPNETIKRIVCNDLRENFNEEMKRNLELSVLSDEKLNIKSCDANELLITAHESYDYIDIDPFGSPNPFLEQAIRRMKKDGILAVTATDTAPLSGTYPAACKRKYWARPKRDENMHERALRILIRKCQLVGAPYDRALKPIYSYSHKHYLRIFFHVGKGKKRVDEILDQHGMWDDSGPLWLGRLADKELATKLADYNKMTERIAAESSIEVVGTHDLHKLSEELKLISPPANSTVIAALKIAGHHASTSHFSGTAIRTTASTEELKRIIRELK